MSVKCGKCGGDAFVADKRRYLVKMQCSDCRVTWFTESKICPKCGRYNGYAVEGICSQCYAIRMEVKLRNA